MVKCPVCGFSGESFAPYGFHKRPNRCCKQCGSVERHRALWLLLEREFLNKPTLRVLDIAPTKGLSDRLSSFPNVDYISIDLNSNIAMYKMDIQNLNFKDGEFDLIICYHVLEHVKDDTKALQELYRVLKPGGQCLIQVPIRRGRYETIEGSNLNPEERTKLFGQPDHLRYYGLDFKDKLESAGFVVNVFGLKNYFSEAEKKMYVLDEEDIYIASKPLSKPIFKKLSEREFEINGIKFLDVRELPKERWSEDVVYIAKPFEMVRWYYEYFKDFKIKNLLEAGIFYGGTAIAYSFLFDLTKYVGIDIKEEDKQIKDLCHRYFKDKVLLYFNTSQDNKEKLKEIIHKDFKEGIDLIIDNGSQLLEPTLAFFEITFPYLRPYGHYVIEDCGWSYGHNFSHYSLNKQGLPSLTNLAILFIIAFASYPEIISKVEFINPSILVIQKGPYNIKDKDNFSIFKLININNKKSLIYLSEKFFKELGGSYNS